MLFSTLPNANDFAPVNGNKFSSVGETTLNMPDKVITRILTIIMTDGIGFLVICTYNIVSFVNVIEKIIILNVTSKTRPMLR